MPCPVPRFSSISCTILGTTTAGDTAPSTAPMTAASIRLMPRMCGASRKNARISQLAGTHAIMTAGRPTRLRSDKSSDRPALIKIMMSAIRRRSDEMDKMESSSQFSTYGPIRIPTSSMPMMRGRPIRLHSAAAARPSRNTSASEVSIVFSSSKRRKADGICVNLVRRSHQL